MAILLEPVLPEGFRDGLPPEADEEAMLIRHLLDFFSLYGYQKATPPLVEYAETLIEGPGKSLSPRLFRFADPATQQLLALRADMTAQIARIAETRLKNFPRPLRLAYGGDVLRVSGSQLHPERQITQIGCELIGPDAPEADVEIIRLATASLLSLSIDNLSVDLALPQLPSLLVAQFDLEEDSRRAFLDALRHHDMGKIALLEGLSAQAIDLARAFIHMSGPAKAMFETFDKTPLPDALKAEGEKLRLLYEKLCKAGLPENIDITIDPVETRGFHYQTGPCFTIFTSKTRLEIGRGGRYETGRNKEPAVGFSFYLDSGNQQGLLESRRPEKIYLPADIAQTEQGRAQATLFRNEGRIVIEGLETLDEKNARKEARSLGCQLLYKEQSLEKITTGEKDE